MSKPEQNTQASVLGLETGLDALQTSQEFAGTIEPVADHDSYDHLALIYESRAEQFATTIPFVREGLARGERCLYIADENDTTEVLEALREAGTDVDAALESDALTLHTAQEAYLRNGAFDPDDMIAFLEDAIAEATTEFDGLRITGEMTWVFGDEPPLEELIEYEAKLNEHLPNANGIALCQYNRERFPPEIIRDVIKTHPHLVYGDTICQNFYYTPPEEFFGADQPDREIDRMMGTLVDRTEARVELQERHQHLQRQNEIVADPESPFEEKLQKLFELGCERFDLELGGLAKVDPTRDRFEVEAVSDAHEHLVPGAKVPLSETYCRVATANEGPTAVIDDELDGLEDSLACETFGVKTYLGSHLELEIGSDRTFFFVSSEPREEAFSDADRTFHHLMAQWVTYELEQREHERRLEASNERLEQFAYAASHDLQEPLRMVTSYLQLVERRYSDTLDDDGEEFIDFAVDGAERMREMIDGLLQYSRVETGGNPFEPTALDAVLEEVLRDLRLQIDEQDAEITAEKLPCVNGDESQLRQVLQNLLSNAITYSGDEPPDVHVSAGRRGREWVVRVRDEGIGIDPADHDRVFTVFDRLHSREKYDGTGIGLALCRRIVERHGGDIWVESRPGQGSTFSFTLPALAVAE